MSFGAYLVGTFEKRLGILTQFQIVNATDQPIELRVVYLDRAGKVLDCKTDPLDGNALWEQDTTQLDEQLPPLVGVVKFFSLVNEELKEAIVGFQRRVAGGPVGALNYAVFGESNLAAVPMEVAVDDFKTVWGQCP